MSEIYDIKSHKTVYKGAIIDVYHDQVILEKNQVATREVVDHVGASAILPIDSDGNIILVKQYRHPAKKVLLEIPAGTLDKGEDPKDCAARELEEEIGMKVNKLTYMTMIYPAVGYSSEKLFIYIAENLVEGKQNLDPDEFVVIEKYSLDELTEMIIKGEIEDSKTIVAILLYKEMINKK